MVGRGGEGCRKWTPCTAHSTLPTSWKYYPAETVWNLNLLFKADLVKLNISGSSLPRGQPKKKYLQGSPELLRGIKNLLKAVRTVHAGKGILLNRQYLTQREYFMFNSGPSDSAGGRGLCVHVCTCMSEYESVHPFLHHWCAHFLWFASWTWPRHGVEWKERRLRSPALSFPMCVSFSELWFSHAQKEDIGVFLAEPWGINEITYARQTIAFQHANNVSFLNPQLTAPEYSR